MDVAMLHGALLGCQYSYMSLHVRHHFHRYYFIALFKCVEEKPYPYIKVVGHALCKFWHIVTLVNSRYQTYQIVRR